MLFHRLSVQLSRPTFILIDFRRVRIAKIKILNTITNKFKYLLEISINIFEEYFFSFLKKWLTLYDFGFLIFKNKPPLLRFQDFKTLDFKILNDQFF